MGWQVATRPEVWGEMRFSAFRSGLLARTLLYNGGAAVLATLLAFPAALVVGRGRGVSARALLVALPLALVMPSIAYTYGWLQVLRLLDLSFMPTSPADVLRCIWTLACWLWPLPALVMGLSLRLADPQLQQQALLDGAFWRLTLRQMLAPALAGLALVLVLAMQEFAVYERSGIPVIATEIRTVFETGLLLRQDPAAFVGGGPPETQSHRAAAAVATALPMLLVVGALSLAALAGIRRLATAERVERDWPRILDAPRWAHALGWSAVALTVLLPVIAMGVSLSPHRWQTDPAGHVMPVRVWLWAWPFAAGTLLYGALTGLSGLGIALLACIRRSPALLALAMAAFLIGGGLLAIADIRIYNSPAPWPLNAARISGRDPFAWIYNNVPVMIIAYLGRFGWLALLAAESTWSRPFAELRDLAALDGAGPARAALHVIWPVALPLLAASALLMAILTMTEVPATALLSPHRPQTLITEMMVWVHMLRNDDMLEASLLLMSLVLVLGVAAILLIRAGLRLTRVLRGGSMAALGAMLVLAGCEKPGQPLAVWCQPGPAAGQLIYPRGITYSRFDDCFFVVDRTARVQRLDREGRVAAHWRMPEFSSGKPVGLSVGPDGNLYIADTHYYRVVVYSPAGQMIRQWGQAGTQPGQFIYPTDVAFDAGGNIYVSEYGDAGTDRIQVFDPTGTRVLRIIGSFGPGEGQFCRPNAMVIDGDLLYVADACNHRIAVFRTDGTFVRNMGSVGSGLGQFRFPYGLDMDSQGRLIVAEFGNNRVQMIDKGTGLGLRSWGVAGRDPGQLAYPWAVTVDKHDRIIVVDSGNDRLQVFSF